MSCCFLIFYSGLQSEASAISSAMLLSLHLVYQLNISFFTLLFQIFGCLSHRGTEKKYLIHCLLHMLVLEEFLLKVPGFFGPLLSIHF